MNIIALCLRPLRRRCRLALMMLAGLGAAFPACGEESAVPAPATASAGTSLDPMADRYRLGQGYRLGDSGFVLGGYGTLSAADAEGEDWRASLDSLSGFLWWDRGGPWQFFSELELQQGLVADAQTLTTHQADVQLERLYVDYAQGDLFKFRVGKFLTPVGRWNLIHASPLVWTTSRPLITEATFPTNATGVMVYGVLPWTAQDVEYSVYASPGVELAPDAELDTFSEAVGGHLSFAPFALTQIGVSYVSFEQDSSREEHKQLLGLDFVWSRRRWEISGEIHYRHAAGGTRARDETGFYLQAVAPLSERCYAVGRYEHFQRSDTDRSLSLYVGGLNYRWRPAVVLKAEYSHASDTDVTPGTGTEYAPREGVLASLAVLF